MRKTARIVGLVWMAAIVAASFVLWATEMMIWVAPLSSNRAMIYSMFGAALPGALLYRWGRGPYQKSVPTREMVAKIYPPKSAQEMGHVARVDR